MAKIANDKYYTPRDLAKRLIDKTYEIIGEENISETIEPSAGDGSFSDQIYYNVCFAYDIEPESEGIIKLDFLKLDCSYLEGRLIIGNPPFGTRNTLSVKFFKKAIQIGDYVAFIQPISQLNNNIQMYEFDLVYSEDLGLIQYTDREIHCCFNIYKRPSTYEVNSKPNYKLKDVEVKEYRRGGKYPKPKDYDFGMCTYGQAIGKEVNFVGEYCQENYIIIKNNKFKKEIIELMRNTNWKTLYNYISTPKIQSWKILKYLKEQITELE